MSFKHWLHHLLNPHCDECLREKECPNCDLLKQLLADERRNNQRIIEFFVPEKNEDVSEKLKIDLTNYKPTKSWRVLREELERNSKAEAQALKRYQEEKDKLKTSELEAEAGVNED
jgi:hypothetical protein